MNLSNEALKLWIEAEERFNRIGELVDKCLKFPNFATLQRNFITKIQEQNSDELFYEVKNGWQDGYMNFIPAFMRWTYDKGGLGVIHQLEWFFEKSGLDLSPLDKMDIQDILLLIGGAEFSKVSIKELSDIQVKAKYRILSNSVVIHPSNYGKESNDFADNINKWINSCFMDNNCVVNIVDFIRQANNRNKLEDINAHQNIALFYPSLKHIEVKSYSLDSIEEHQHKQQMYLKTRFPFKFFWMWANKDRVIHLLSLKAFRNFLDSEIVKQVIQDNQGILKIEPDSTESILHAEFDTFTTIWEILSKCIIDTLELQQSDITKISKIISLSALIK